MVRRKGSDDEVTVEKDIESFCKWCLLALQKEFALTCIDN